MTRRTGPRSDPRTALTSPLVDELYAEWELVPDGAPMRGSAGVVLPVLTRAGSRAALKVGRVHAESEHEHLALTRWDRDVAVRLLRADPRRGALLLERLTAVNLVELWDVEPCTTAVQR